MNIIEKKKRQMGQGGFTLIELLVVIAILAVLAGLAVIGIGAMRDNAEKQACKTDADTLGTAAEAWVVDNPNTALTSANAEGTLGPSGSKLVKKWTTSDAWVAVDANGGVSTGGCP